MSGTPKDGAPALAPPAEGGPSDRDRSGARPRPDSPDWRSAGVFRIFSLSPAGTVPPLLREALQHPSLAGIPVESSGLAEAGSRLEALLAPGAFADGFTAVHVEGGAEALILGRTLAERFPGDHWHCLAATEASPEAAGWPSGGPAWGEVLPRQGRAEDLASRLRYLGRIAAERARRIAAEREAVGMGRQLNETQGRLKLTRVLEEAVERLQRVSSTDGLTGIANRARFEETLDLEWGQAVGGDTPISVILIDIDYFKRYNDCYGHLLGDACLQKVARSLLTARESSHDQVARFGGEEFVVLLPGRDAEAARRVAERLRAGAEALAIPNANSGVSAHVTISAGVATSIPDLTSSAVDLIQRADRALYQAKRDGRNRVAVD